MALLAASTSKPSVSALHQRPDLISSLSPLLHLAARFQQLLSSASLLLLAQTLFAGRALANTIFLASSIVACWTLFASKSLAASALRETRRLTWATWDSKRSRRIRKKIQYEFFVLVLGPGGNALCLLLFWPGWLVLGATTYALTSGAR